MTERPEISSRLVDYFEAWLVLLNSGPSPKPNGFVGEIAWRDVSSGEQSLTRERHYSESELIATGVKLDDAFRKLTEPQRVCINVHIRWSAYNPLTGVSIAWPAMRAHEARQARMRESDYEATLTAALAYLEHVCA